MPSLISKKPPQKNNSYYQKFIDLLYDGLKKYGLQQYFHNEKGEKLNAEQIYKAPFILLSHNKQTQQPKFCYANKKGLELFEYKWKEFIQTPSKNSVNENESENRKKLFKQVENKGFIEQYSGIRVSKNGKLFKIANVLVWNSPNKKYQSALIKNWNYLQSIK